MSLDKFHHSPMGCNVEIRLVSIQFTSFWDVSMWQTVVFSSFIGRKDAAYIAWFVSFLLPTTLKTRTQPSPARNEERLEWRKYSEYPRHACLSGEHGSYSNAELTASH